jgi:hypothetical protein
VIYIVSYSPVGCQEISTGNSQRAVRRWIASNILTSLFLILPLSDLSREFPCIEITIEWLFAFVAIATEFLVCCKFPRHGDNRKIPMKAHRHDEFKGSHVRLNQSLCGT